VITTNSLRALNKEDKMFAAFESADTNFWQWVSQELKNWEPMKM
jgi:hypothetical protein